MHIEIKQTPSDFVVEEIIKLDVKKEGSYLYVKITKTNLNTLDVVKILEERLRIPRKFISFAGSKDKKAITTQYFSIKGVRWNNIERIEHSGIKIEFGGYGDKPISLGSLEGNRFTITLDFKPKIINEMINYFGEQRFSKNNAGIGKAIIQKDFKKAVELIDDIKIKEHLDSKENDFVGAIKLLDKKLISLYINSYQSFLWNNVLVEYLKSKLKKSEYAEHESLVFPKNKIKNIQIPLVSFDTEFVDKKIKNIYEKLLEKEGIKLSDFVIRQFPEQTPATVVRDAVVQIKDFKWNDGKLQFILPKGSYATVLIKEMGAFS